MIDKKNFLGYIDLAYQQISSLPTGEIKYYLFLLTRTIEEKNNKKTQQFLTGLFDLLKPLKKLYELAYSNDSEFNELLNQIWEQFTKLSDIAETNSLDHQLKIYLLNTGGATLAFTFGLAGGLIGGTAGFVRGTYNFKPLRGTGVGVLTGVLLGGSLGFRLPKKLFKQELQRQMKFGLDGLKSTIEEKQKEELTSPFFSSKVKPFATYLNEVKNEIRKLFTSEEQYQQFLGENIDYEINTKVATFIGDPMLAGYLGHHTYIKINIKEARYLIEYSPGPSDLSKPPAQSEKRTTNGQQLIDMLAYHRKLQETHTCNVSYLLTKAKPGDTDCLSYVNKVLIGTNQEATHLKRFTDMTKVGNVYGSIIEKLSPFKPDFFHRKEKTVSGEQRTSNNGSGFFSQPQQQQNEDYLLKLELLKR